MGDTDDDLLNELRNRFKWISVKDRLPDSDGTYLCFMDRGLKPGETKSGDSPFGGKYQLYQYHVTPKSLGHKVPSWLANGWAGDVSKYITHWMPLPEPPK